MHCFQSAVGATGRPRVNTAVRAQRVGYWLLGGLSSRGSAQTILCVTLFTAAAGGAPSPTGVLCNPGPGASPTAVVIWRKFHLGLWPLGGLFGVGLLGGCRVGGVSVPRQSAGQSSDGMALIASGTAIKSKHGLSSDGMALIASGMRAKPRRGLQDRWPGCGAGLAAVLQLQRQRVRAQRAVHLEEVSPRVLSNWRVVWGGCWGFGG